MTADVIDRTVEPSIHQGSLPVDTYQFLVLVGIVALIMYVLAKLNSAIKLLNNRVNIISHVQKQMRRDAGGHDVEDEFERQERELRAALDRDFK